MTNRLAGQTSPYLRQHADNPVSWWPWSPDAFAEARRRDVPVLLSVGYAACHWCHVMAHESFENADVAAVMNEGFVNIKVDREERPDVDRIYLDAVTAISGSAGWPMTVFLLPDGRPFFGGTYFPRQQFVQLLEQVAKVWQERRTELEADAAHLADALQRAGQLPSLTMQPTGLPEPPPVDQAAAAHSLLSYVDPEWGGFGRAPKFPQPTLLELLLAGGETEALTITLDAMASGGIYDHLGGGFARYATDRRWLVPHFEKMLYDNAQLIRLYTHAWQRDAQPRYAQVVEETVGYLLREPMLLPDGGLASSEDADSEGVEGRFYTWNFDELVAVAGPAAASWYGAAPTGNWDHTNILWRPERAQLLRPPAIEEARRALFATREQRVRPGLDDKVLTEWNAMAVTALAEAGAAFARPDWVDAAAGVAGVLLARGRGADGRWLRVVPRPEAAAGSSDALAYAGDYAWLVEAFSRLAEVTGQARWVAEARTVADELLRLFWDETGGGFWTTGHDAETLIARVKDTDDGALPAANSVAAAALVRLSALTGEDRYRQPVEQLLAALGTQLAQNPMRYAGLIRVAHQLRGLREVVVTGDRPDLVAVVLRAYSPDVVLAWGEPYPSPLWEGRTDPSRADRAYVCRHGVCAAPVGEAGQLQAQLVG